MSPGDSVRVEFVSTARMILAGNPPGLERLEPVVIARVFPLDARKTAQPHIVLAGDTLAAALEQVRLWDEAGRPAR